MKRLTCFLAFILPLAAIAQTGSEIYLFDMKAEDKKIILSGPVNITQHKGYDSQPYFASNDPVIYYTAGNDSGSTDINTYNYNTKKTGNFTSTKESEFSPTLTPDKKFISCIIQRQTGAQDLGKYPLDGRAPVILVNNLIVGYHSWIDNNSLLLFILDDRVNSSLHYYNLTTKEDKPIIKNPGRSLHKIPGGDAMSFVDKSLPNEWMIKKLDCKTISITNICTTITGHEDLCWTNKGLILMSNGEKIFYYQPGSNAGWQLISFAGNNAAFKNITRIAVNDANTKLAIVAGE